MALLKTAEPGGRRFLSVRIAPLYDAVTTRVFPNLKHDRMAWKLHGKDHNLRRSDFRALATTAGFKVATADQAVDELLLKITQAVDSTRLPDDIRYEGDGEKRVEEMLEICRSRIGSFA